MQAVPHAEFALDSQRPNRTEVVTASAVSTRGVSIQPATTFRIHDLDSESSAFAPSKPHRRLVVERLHDQEEATFDYFTP